MTSWCISAWSSYLSSRPSLNDENELPLSTIGTIYSDNLEGDDLDHLGQSMVIDRVKNLVKLKENDLNGLSFNNVEIPNKKEVFNEKIDIDFTGKSKFDHLTIENAENIFLDGSLNSHRNKNGINFDIAMRPYNDNSDWAEPVNLTGGSVITSNPINLSANSSLKTVGDVVTGSNTTSSNTASLGVTVDYQ